MRYRLILMAVIAAGWAVHGDQVCAAETYTVDHMLRSEHIGDVEVDPRGRYVVFEYQVPYQEAGEFWWSMEALFFNMPRTRLYQADLESGGKPEPLFPGQAARGYKLGPLSPDGARISYLRETEEAAVVGVYDFEHKHSVEFAPIPDPYGVYPRWISPHELIFAQTTPRRLSMSFERRVMDSWRTMRQGRISTGSTLGSGRYDLAVPVDGERGLVIGDVRTGVTRRIASGAVMSPVAVSPDQKLLAVVFPERRAPDVTRPFPQRSFELFAKRLRIVDLTGRGVDVSACQACDIEPESLAWSARGHQLAFVTRDTTIDAAQRLWVVARAGGAARPIDLKGLMFPGARAGNEPDKLDFVWLDASLIVRAQDGAINGAGQGSATTIGRAAWFRIRTGAPPVNLTKVFGSQTLELAGVAGGALVMLADGGVWSVNKNASRRRLTPSEYEPLKLSRVIQDRGSFSARAISALTLETQSSDISARKRNFFLDLAAGALSAIDLPAGDSRLMAVAPSARRAVVLTDHNNVSSFAVQEANGEMHELKILNAFLRDVSVGQAERIDHRGPEGEMLTSWILLPPSRQNGERVPTIAHIYPGLAYSDKNPFSGLSVVDFLNPQLLASRGYAVLFPSLPEDENILPREPSKNLAARVLAAVDAAIARGYTDGQRTGVQGLSYGGNATVTVLTQTDRFKTGVAAAGSYNLISMYGAPRVSDRFNMESEGRELFMAVGWAETGQGGMGAPPWRDPERYLRNSPLMQVDSIRAPLLFFHGDLDATVPFSQSEELFTALYRLGRDAVFVRYWGEGHRVAVSPANIRDASEKLIGWYDEHLR